MLTQLSGKSMILYKRLQAKPLASAEAAAQELFFLLSVRSQVRHHWPFN